MLTWLIGNMKDMEYLYQWLQVSNEIFEVNMIFSEDDISSEVFTCDIRPIDELISTILDYDICFVCSPLDENYRKILCMLGGKIANELRVLIRSVNIFRPKTVWNIIDRTV